VNGRHDPQSRFEERLLSELRRVVIEQPSESPAARGRTGFAPSGFRYKRTLALSGGLAAATGVAIAAGLPLGGDGGGTEAYAVTKHQDGTVTVEIEALSDAAGLERELAAAGVPALVQYLPPGKTCKGVPVKGTPTPEIEPPGAGGPLPEAAESGTAMRTHEDGSVAFTLDGRERPDQTLVIRTQEFAGGGQPSDAPAEGPLEASAVSVAFEEGEPRPCEVIDAG
jgi:hypothetical protein